ncbi:MAG: efflux pump, inner rane subunit [Myxococcales bacterium]|nr:efflux pump, inner rane subunit [Myxococcales bacterium]
MRIWRRLRGLVLKRRREQEMDEELRFHLEMQTRENVAAGMSPEEARLAALRAFGGVEQVKEECRDVRGTRVVEWLGQDVRFGWRVLRRAPGFTAVAVVTLALGIGANSAMFSLVHTVLLRPLPFPAPNELVVVSTSHPGAPIDYVSYPDLRDWRAGSRSFSDLAGVVGQTVNLTGRDEPTRVRGSFVTANFLSMLSVQPALGRGFSAHEDEPGAERVVLVAHALWKSMFVSDPALVGKRLALNGQLFTVVGILPESFKPWMEAEVFIPLCHYPNFSLDRAKTSAEVIGRLRPGVTADAAQAELATVARGLALAYPATNRDRGVVVRPLHSVLVEDVRPSLLLLFGAVALVLLIACANVSNLLLSRAVSRQREMAVRTALGAGKARLVRQLLTESLLLWGLGAVAGLAVARVGTDLLAASPLLPRSAGPVLVLDYAVFGFTLALSFVTGLFFGAVPAMQAARTNVQEALKESGRGAGQTSGRRRMQSLLVVSQIALAVVLVTGAGLATRSLVRLNAVDPGFQPDHLLTLEYRLPRNKYPTGAGQWEFHRAVVERVQALPGVRSAAVVRALPFSGNGNSTAFVLPDRPRPPAGQEPQAEINVAHPRYFATMAIPLLRGRVFSDEDRADSPAVVVVNRSLAERFWPGADPVGKQLRLVGGLVDGERQVSIIGVVGDIKHQGLDDPRVPQIYAPQSQVPFIFASLVVRTELEPLALADSVRSAIWSIDGDQPVWKVRTLDWLMDSSLRSRALTARLLAAYSAFALLLAALGIYGVISYVVSQRTHEIGIRMALGAPRGRIVRSVLRRGFVLAGWGLALGGAASAALARLIRNQLFEVTASDPLTFAAALALLASVALFACWIPARRATRIDPVTALRAD